MTEVQYVGTFSFSLIFSSFLDVNHVHRGKWTFREAKGSRLITISHRESNFKKGKLAVAVLYCNRIARTVVGKIKQ